MIRKTPKSVPLGRKIIGGLIVLECALFGVSYFGWNRLNNSREFRLATKEKFPWALEKYYQLGEFVDSNNLIRKLDHQVWSQLDFGGSKSE